MTNPSRESQRRTQVHQRCRNPRCRLKLKEPVGNKHRAFCCRGCYDGFYLGRCRVCEKDISIDPLTGERRKRLGQRLFHGRTCKAEAARFPHVYAWVLPDPARSSARSNSAHSAGIKFGIKGERPQLRCLRDWWWGGVENFDFSLYDQDGLTLARLVLGTDGHYHLRTPVAIPHQSWADLKEAKRSAEGFALMAMPLDAVDPKFAARATKDNSTPHPMGPPLNRPWPSAGEGEVLFGANSKIAEAGINTYLDPGPIPNFLQRKRRSALVAHA
jgi:hypothetical protein